MPHISSQLLCKRRMFPRSRHPSGTKKRHRQVIKRPSYSCRLKSLRSWDSALEVDQRPQPLPKDPRDFEMIKFLEKGSFGKVYLVKERSSDKLFALKTLDKTLLRSQHTINSCVREMRIGAKVQHPFILQLECAFQSEHKLFMLIKFCPGGDLSGAMREKSFTEKQTMFYVAEIALALDYLHRNKILFRDLKPNNVLIGADGHSLLCDFGLSRDFTAGPNPQETGHSRCGTPHYMSPEVVLCGIDGIQALHGYSYPADFWSLGILMFQLFFRITPVEMELRNGMQRRLPLSTEAIYQCIIYREIFIPDTASESFRSVIKGLLMRNPDERFNLKNLTASEAFSDIDWDKLLQKELAPPFIPSSVNVHKKRRSSLIDDDDECLKPDTTMRDKLKYDDEFKNFNFNRELETKVPTAHVIRRCISAS